LDHEPSGEQRADLVKVDILLQGEAVDAFSAIVHKDKAYNYGVAITAKLRSLIPRQQFEVPIQAAIGSRVIARETIRAMATYSPVLRRHHAQAQATGAAEGRQEADEDGGRVEVPQEAFIAALSIRHRGHREGSGGRK
jgi:GTP-binding protein LepA